MASYAIISNNVIVNVIEWDGGTPFAMDKSIVIAPLDKLPQGAAFPPSVPAELSDAAKLQQDVAAIKVKVGA